MCLEHSSHEIYKKENESKSDPTKEITYFSAQLYISNRKKNLCNHTAHAKYQEKL